MFNNRLITFKYIFIFYAIVLREREREREIAGYYKMESYFEKFREELIM